MVSISPESSSQVTLLKEFNRYQRQGRLLLTQHAELATYS